ncbi:unnamed protein product [Rotaria sp. Silwood1]|nr:unnamed protein product [Rotaria sp. Silwood1]
MTLGVVLGLLMSLSVIIPIVIIWQTAGSKSSTTSSPSSSTVAGLSSSSLIVSSEIGTCDSYFCENKLYFFSNMTITALSLVITVQRTANSTYSGAYSSYSPTINSINNITSSQIIYQFFIQTGQLPAGNYTCVGQYNLLNVNHATSADTYSISTTNICGMTSSATGNFP